MGDRRHHDGFRRRVARQPVGHDGARHHPESLQEFAKDALRGACAPAALHQNVEHLARVIDGPPELSARTFRTLWRELSSHRPTSRIVPEELRDVSNRPINA
jgi:hypothetical protein